MIPFLSPFLGFMVRPYTLMGRQDKKACPGHLLTLVIKISTGTTAEMIKVFCVHLGYRELWETFCPFWAFYNYRRQYSVIAKGLALGAKLPGVNPGSVY